MKKFVYQLLVPFLALSCATTASAVMLAGRDLQGINVAQAKHGASISGISQEYILNEQSPHYAHSSNLIDGTTDGWYNWYFNSSTRSTVAIVGSESDRSHVPWVTIDFKARTRVTDVALFGRTDCQACWEDLSNYVVEFYKYYGDTPVNTISMDASRFHMTLSRPTVTDAILPEERLRTDGSTRVDRHWYSHYWLDSRIFADGIRIRRKTAGLIQLAEVVVIGNYVAPAPAVLGLMGLGFVGVAAAARRRKRKVA